MRFDHTVMAAVALAWAAAGCAGFERGEASPAPPCVDVVDEVFARDVHPILVERCAGCHGPSGPASSTALVFSGDVDADRTAVLAHVTPLDAERSPLLRKGTGMGHGGGASIAAGSAQYQVIVDWIAGDASLVPMQCTDAGSTMDGGTPMGPDGGRDGSMLDGEVPDAGDAEPPDSSTGGSGGGGTGPDASLDAPSFEQDVYPLLFDDCAVCHASGGPAGATALLFTGAAADDYAAVRALVDVDDAEASALLTEARGEGHGGGVRFAIGTDAYRTLSDWIDAGALP